MNLYSLLSPQNIITNHRAESKTKLIHLLIDSLKNQIEDDDKIESIRNAVLEREAVMSTGVGKGLAIPHAKTEVIDENLAAFAVLDEPLDFDSIDKKPVQLVFLLISPKHRNSDHIKLLSRISRLMNSGSFREEITNCSTPEEVLEAFQKEEETYFVT